MTTNRTVLEGQVFNFTDPIITRHFVTEKTGEEAIEWARRELKRAYPGRDEYEVGIIGHLVEPKSEK
jgi:hypothetical protein